MARIRTIKPEFWTDSKTGTMPESAKCLFIGMLNHCDDFGVLEWLPGGVACQNISLPLTEH